MRPLISCILPTRNGERFIGPAIESLLRQTWRPLEILVIDDGSTDRTFEIARSFGDPVQVFQYSVSNPVLARNYGISLAQGEFLSFMDHDDLCRLDKLALQMAAFDADPKLDVCVGYVQRIGQSSTLERRVDLDLPVPGYLMITSLARRRAFEEVGKLNPANLYSDSTEWFLRARTLGIQVQLLPETLVYHREHDDNLSLIGFDQSHKEFLRLLKSKLDRERALKSVLAIGIETSSPSWEWVGRGIASELLQYFDIVYFDHFNELPIADIILVIKQRPPTEFVRIARDRGIQVFFAPIDIYQNEREIMEDVAMLGACEAVLLHSEELCPILAPYCRSIARVEHHGRFTLDRLVDFKNNGFLLWIGSFQYVPLLVQWLEKHPPPIPVLVLTDLNNRLARVAGHFKAHQLGLTLNLGHGRVNGHRVFQWSEATQANLMQTCKAALDIKGTSFDQMTKPPTKAQQFISSGIPFGCNEGHPAMSFFRLRGFKLAHAGDFDRLLSKTYWEETRSFAGKLRERISLDAVGRSYLQILSKEISAEVAHRETWQGSG